jgi:hypothetical protein
MGSEVLNLDKRNKYLILIIVILVIAVSVTGYFVYMNYTTSQMDEYMAQATYLSSQSGVDQDDANNILNASSQDYNKALSLINDSINLQNQTLSDDGQAYQYANGPYKDLINMSLTRDRYDYNLLTSWRDRIIIIQQNSTGSVTQLLGEEQTIETNSIEANDDYLNFLLIHPDVKEHVIKYWNSTNV